MRCPTCGTEIEHPGQSHACVPSPPVSAAEWASATRRVVSFAAFFGAAALAAAVVADSLADLSAVTADDDPAARAGLAIGTMIITLLAIGSMLGLLISWLFWWRCAQRLTAKLGAPGHGHLGYWGSGAFAVAFAASYIVPARLDDTKEALATQASLRVAGVAVLIAGVLHTRAWLRRRDGSGPEPYATERYSLVTGGDPISPMSATPTADDWDASAWDPAVQREIERRRERP